MNDRDHAATLLTKAEADVNALRGMATDAGHFTDDIYGFHAQQAVEKCFKAWLAVLSVRYRRTHDLMDLIDALRAAGQETAAYESLIDLTPFAVQLRYDVADPDGDPLDRAAVLADVQGLFNFVQGMVGP